MISRYRIAPADREQFVSDAERAIDVLAAQHGFLSASIGQSTDESGLLLIRSEWVGVGAYRRALSSYDVKVSAVPLLSTAVDESSAFEVVRNWSDGEKSSAASGRAADS